MKIANLGNHLNLHGIIEILLLWQICSLDPEGMNLLNRIPTFKFTFPIFLLITADNQNVVSNERHVMELVNSRGNSQ